MAASRYTEPAGLFILSALVSLNANMTMLQ
jgi:hypothetical protein